MSRDDKHIAITITSYFDDMPDPRIDRSKLHPLSDIVLLTLIAVLGGADNWVHIENFGKAHEEWLRGFLELPWGVPSHDTLGRVFRKIDSAELGRRLALWMDALRETAEGGHIAIDGKTLTKSSRFRGSWASLISKDRPSPSTRLAANVSWRRRS